jgi:hypothetical protein
MTVYLTNAFSLNMVVDDHISCEFTKVQPETAAEIIDGVVGTGYFINAIGHPDTDAVVRHQLSQWLGDVIPAGQRANVYAQNEFKHVIAQYRGPRLPEGTTSLPEGATIEYWVATFKV